MIIEGVTRKVFCSEMCIHSHLRADSEHIICYICCHRMRFYDAIRQAYDSQNFCSMNCSIVFETGMDLLMHNVPEKCAIPDSEQASYDKSEGNK